ncbi:MAG: hypothetical protein ACRDBG_04500 [Waterburya sp.]
MTLVLSPVATDIYLRLYEEDKSAAKRYLQILKNPTPKKVAVTTRKGLPCKKWTEAEIAILKDCYERKLSLKEISKILNRSTDAIANKRLSLTRAKKRCRKSFP